MPTGNLPGTAGRGVSLSEDGGVSWTNTGVSQSQGLMLSIDTTGAVYVGTNVDGAIMLPAGGQDWSRLAWDELKTCACQQGHGITVDPSNHDHVFFTTNDGGLLVTEDGGLSSIRSAAAVASLRQLSCGRALQVGGSRQSLAASPVWIEHELHDWRLRRPG